MNIKSIRNYALATAAVLAAVFGVLNAQAARIPLGALTTLNTSTHLDPMFVDLYDLRELITTPSYTAATPKLRFGANYQLGVGVSPQAWGLGTAVQVGDYASIFYDGVGGTGVGNNLFYSGGYKYTAGAVSSLYYQIAGGHKFLHAPSGTAGGSMSLVTDFEIDVNGNARVVGSGGLGYGTGAGGTVTQATSKSTAVTLNKATGQITMNAAALAAGATVGFQLNSSAISAGDIVLVQTVSGMANAQNYLVNTGNTISSAASIYLTNRSGGSLSEAVVLSFAVIKIATS